MDLFLRTEEGVGGEGGGGGVAFRSMKNEGPNLGHEALQRPVLHIHDCP
jgi:hypothetical protein